LAKNKGQNLIGVTVFYIIFGGRYFH